MKTKIIEATEATVFNYGKFLVGRFEDEWAVPSQIGTAPCLLSRLGWSKEHLLVLDLQTGEGAIFRPGGFAEADLAKHMVWICPLFQSFLTWLYKQDLTDLDKLPSVVNLGEVPTAFYGHRTKGPDLGEQLSR